MVPLQWCVLYIWSCEHTLFKLVQFKHIIIKSIMNSQRELESCWLWMNSFFPSFDLLFQSLLPSVLPSQFCPSVSSCSLSSSQTDCSLEACGIPPLLRNSQWKKDTHCLLPSPSSTSELSHPHPPSLSSFLCTVTQNFTMLIWGARLE